MSVENIVEIDQTDLILVSGQLIGLDGGHRGRHQGLIAALLVGISHEYVFDLLLGFEDGHFVFNQGLLLESGVNFYI